MPLSALTKSRLTAVVLAALLPASIPFGTAVQAQAAAPGGASCIRFIKDAYGMTAMTTSCPVPISVSVCFINPVQKTYSVQHGERYYDLQPCELDSSVAFSVVPGQSHPIGRPAEIANGFVWVECYDARAFSSDILGFDRATSTPRGSCPAWDDNDHRQGRMYIGNSYAALGHVRPSRFSTANEYSQRAVGPPVGLSPPPGRLQPLTSLGQLASTGYPLAALRAEHQGRVAFELTVNPAGMVVGCQISQSSGFADLDQGTCDLMMRAARFAPTGQSGNASYRSAISWRL